MAHKTHQVIEAIEDSYNEGLEDGPYSLYKMTSRKCDPIMTMVTANGVELKMEVDTGTSVSIISEYTYNKLWTHNMPTTGSHTQTAYLHWRNFADSWGYHS